MFRLVKMMKYTKIEQMVQRSALKKSYSLDRFEQVERSKICHIYRKDKNGSFVFDFFGADLSKMDQSGSNLIKLDQIGFPHQSKNVPINICHNYRKDKNGCFVFDFFGLDLSKMDQT